MRSNKEESEALLFKLSTGHVVFLTERLDAEP
ncbi:hypothetical protein LMG26411_06299 [Cupriavidus numazuensis]|uniref:Uncharacterized protein n=1 Tax=Cupriavidus numazuensis TaxID=221992 RepID=A0ABN7Q6Y5_9BURK|nr:hypothetical protein LMG26411_06299 [Cupriavidus numazuensis]